ncbi:MAG: DUF3786 domain-containing protein [Elusimicrobiota bacterium]
MKPPDYNQIRLEQLWQELASSVPENIARKALVKYAPAASGEGGNFYLPFLNQEYVFSLTDKTMIASSGPITNFIHLWVFLSYLLGTKDIPLANSWVSEKELTDGAFFFKGPHQLYVDPISKKFGHNREAFLKRGLELGGEKLSGYGDAALRLPVFPRLPLLYVLWTGDEEFPPNVKILFDPTVTSHLNLDTIWGLVQIVTKHF